MSTLPLQLVPVSRTTDRVVWLTSWLALTCGVSLLFVVIAFLVQQVAAGASLLPSLSDFLWVERWVPLANPPRLGIFHAWVATLFVTLISLVVAVPVGVAIAVFASELAPPALRAVLQPALEVLAGIPSVVYGFFGLVTLVVWIERGFDLATGVSMLAAGLIVALMILPFIASTSAEALAAVPSRFRDAALSAGVTRTRMICRVLIPAALPGIFAGVALGFARGIGETLAALMLAGNALSVPSGLLDRGQTLTGLIATDLGEAAVGTPKYHALFLAALVLLFIVLAINAAILLLKRRMLRHATD